MSLTRAELEVMRRRWASVPWKYPVVREAGGEFYVVAGPFESRTEAETVCASATRAEGDVARLLAIILLGIPIDGEPEFTATRGPKSEASRRRGALIKRLRRSMGISQHGLAQRAGVAQAQVSRLELGQARVRVDILERLAHALQVPVGDLMLNGHANGKAVTGGEP